MSDKQHKSSEHSSTERKSRKSIHVMLREVDGDPGNTSYNRLKSKLIGVTALEELLMDHQALHASENEKPAMMVGLDDALIQLQIEG